MDAKKLAVCLLGSACVFAAFIALSSSSSSSPSVQNIDAASASYNKFYRLATNLAPGTPHLRSPAVSGVPPARNPAMRAASPASFPPRANPPTSMSINGDEQPPLSPLAPSLAAGSGMIGSPLMSTPATTRTSPLYAMADSGDAESTDAEPQPEPETPQDTESSVELSESDSLEEYGAAGVVGATGAALAAGSLATAKSVSAAALTTPLQGGAPTPKSALADKLMLGAYFAIWYALTIAYNISNKKVLNALPLPWLQSTCSLLVGIPYVLALWGTGVRTAPKLTSTGMKKLIPVGVLHAAGHVAAVLAFTFGAVSFGQIVKSAEPVFTALFSGVMLGQVFHPLVYASLIPVIAGVAIASLSELAFSWMAFGSAMTANVTSALRAILAKQALGDNKEEVGENLTAPNLYAVLTIIASAASLPLAMLFEGSKWSTVWAASIAAPGVTAAYLLKHILLSGIYFYLYNEVAFLCLDKVHPVTHAVANTIKRVAIIGASVVAFGTPMTALGVGGSGIAIGGVLLYSLAKHKFGNKPKPTPPSVQMA